MNDININNLSNLKMEERCLKRMLDLNYYKKEARDKHFARLLEVQKEIRKLKFKIRLERQMKKEGDNL